MGDITYKELRKQVSEELSPRMSDFSSTVVDIGRNFRNLGFETAVWLPESIHTANLGGIDADSYIGYSRIEGRWGLRIRTIERDHESGSFVTQRVQTLESCSNMEIVMNSLKKIPEKYKPLYIKDWDESRVTDSDEDGSSQPGGKGN